MPTKLTPKKKTVTQPSYAGLRREKVKQIILPGPKDLNQPSQVFTDYTTLIYGAKGVGKTTATASFPDCLNVSWEPRRRNVAIRMYSLELKQSSEITDDDDDPWIEFVEVCRLAAEDPTVKTLAIDTVDICYSACQEHICRIHGVTNPGDKKDFGKTWNDLKFTFTALFRTLSESGLSLIFISHSKEREQELMEGVDSVTLIGPSCASSCLTIMKQLCDFWFFYGYHEGKRCLTIRDSNRNVDVAAGYGFFDASGEPIDKIYIPNDPMKFYDTVNSAFISKTPVTKGGTVKRPVRKLPPRKS